MKNPPTFPDIGSVQASLPASGEPFRRHALRAMTAAGIAALLSSCGFQLRGAANLPFRSIFIGFAENSPLGNELRRYIRASDNTRIVNDPKDAEVILDALGETRDRQILSLNSQGRVREIALFYRIRFRLRDAAQREVLPPTEISVKRDITYNESLALSKEAEESLLYRDMQSDLVQQILRRLEALRPQA